MGERESPGGLRAWRAAAELVGGLLLAALGCGLLELTPSSPPASMGEGPAVVTEVLREHAQPVASYALLVELDPEAHALHGRGTVRFKNVSRRPLLALAWHRYLDAWRSERTRFRRGPGGFRGRRASPVAVGGLDVERMVVRGVELVGSLRSVDPKGEDDTDAVVDLPAPIAPGEEVEIELQWTARLPPIELRTGWSGTFHMAAQWFPKLAKLEPDGTFRHFPFERLAEFYADFGTYDVTVRVPPAFDVAATGHLVRDRRQGDVRELTFHQEDVHDFAFAAWDRFVVRSRRVGDVSVRIFFPPGFERTAERSLDAVEKGLAHYGARYGEYPHRDLTVLHPPRGADEAGGMEYPTLIATGGAWEAGWLPSRATEWMVLHELAHQWFQGVVATDEAAHPFLDEGLTSFATADAMRSLYGEDSFSGGALVPLSVEALERVGSLLASSAGPLDRPAASFDAGEYGSVVYFRSELLLSSLERTFGPPLLDAVGDYARTHRFGHPTPGDLLAALGRHLPEPATRAARAAMEGSSHVDLSVTSASCERGACAAVVARAGPLPFPVWIRFTFEDGSTVSRVWDAGTADANVVVSSSGALAGAEIDPDRRLLLDVDLQNGAWSPRPRFPVRAALLAGLSGQLLARYVLP